MDNSDLKNTTLTREHISQLLESIGKPGENREEKYQAVKDLEKKNGQGYGIELSLESYENY